MRHLPVTDVNTEDKERKMEHINNIRMDLREIWWEDVDWIHLAPERGSGGLLQK